MGNQEPDFEILTPSGSIIGALEVTEATNPQTRAATRARTKHFPAGVFPAPGLAHNWHLFPAPRTTFRKLEKSAPALLSKVEASGCTQFFASTDLDPAVQGLFQLGIEAGFRWSASSSPRVILALPGDHTIWEENPSTPAPYLTGIVGIHAHKRDNIAKLRQAHVTERHLFIWVDRDFYLPWKDLVHGRLPVGAPVLP
ncbi:MAG: hypothetical protein ABIJ48_01670 [Actinomycetota bacterium]